MTDVETLLVANLFEALRQVQRYVVLGLGTSVSALALTIAAPGNAQFMIPGTFVPVDAPTARGILLAICFLVGAMATYAADNAKTVAERLKPSELLDACRTYPSIATSPYWGVRAAAAILPMFFALSAIGITAVRAGGLTWATGTLGFLILAVYASLAVEWRRAEFIRPLPERLRRR